jgi:hypothetical protein
MARTRNLGNLTNLLTAGTTYATGATPPVGDNSTNLATTGFVAQNTGHGQCRLVYTSTTSVTLNPKDGNRLIINGQSQMVPSAGVVGSITGLTASTVYYVYAYMNSGVMALEFSTTTHATNTTTNVEQKSGDPTRTLVGMIYVGNTNTISQTGSILTVSSYFSRVGKCLQIGLSANTSSTTFVNLHSGTPVQWLNWSDDQVIGVATGYAQSTSVGNSVSTAAFVDGTQYAGSVYTSSAAGYFGALNANVFGPVTEGLHNAFMYGLTSNGTATYNLSLQIYFRA